MYDTTESLDLLDEIQFAIQQYEDEESSVLEDIGYITEERRKELNLKGEALSSLYEIRKYLSGYRTLSSDKVDRLMDPIYNYFIKQGDQQYVIDFILPFRLECLP